MADLLVWVVSDGPISAVSDQEWSFKGVVSSGLFYFY